MAGASHVIPILETGGREAQHHLAMTVRIGGALAGSMAGVVIVEKEMELAHKVWNPNPVHPASAECRPARDPKQLLCGQALFRPFAQTEDRGCLIEAHGAPPESSNRLPWK